MTQASLTPTQDAIYRFNTKDVKALLKWDELPSNAGPLFHTVLNGISALSKMCYGFKRPKRSFIKFAQGYMEMRYELANLLYTCMRSTHATGMWVNHVAITTAHDKEVRKGLVFYLYGDRVLFDVIELAEKFLVGAERAKEQRLSTYDLPPEKDEHGEILKEAREVIFPTKLIRRL